MNAVHRFIEWIKTHPYESVGAIVALLTLYLLLRGGSSSSANSTSAYDTAALDANAQEVAANTQYQEAQLAANQQSATVQAQASVANNQTSAQLSAVQIQAQTTQNVAGIQANQNEILGQLQAQTTDAISSLQAQVEDTQTQAQVAIQQSNNNAITTIASLPYSQPAQATKTLQLYTGNPELGQTYYNSQGQVVLSAQGTPGGSGYRITNFAKGLYYSYQ